jgi:hypothetical protein
MLKNPTDNYYSVQQAIAKRVLSTPLASSIGYGGIGSHGYNEIKRIADGEKSDRYGYASVEFRRADTNCDLSIRANAKNDYGSTREVDADGNEWVSYSLTVEVGYPSHGSSDPATVMARVNLISQVAMLAAEINAEFGGRNEIRKMVCSAAEVAERKAKIEADLVKSNINKFVRLHSKGMRVGSDRTIERSTSALPIPEGSYTCDLGDSAGNIKKYGVAVRATTVLVWRVA